MSAPSPRKKASPKPRSVVASVESFTYNELIEFEEITGDNFEDFHGPKAQVPVIGPNGKILTNDNGEPWMQPKSVPATHLRAIAFLVARRDEPGLTIEEFGSRPLPTEVPKVRAVPDPPGAANA